MVNVPLAANDCDAGCGMGVESESSATKSSVLNRHIDSTTTGGGNSPSSPYGGDGAAAAPAIVVSPDRPKAATSSSPISLGRARLGCGASATTTKPPSLRSTAASIGGDFSRLMYSSFILPTRRSESGKVGNDDEDSVNCILSSFKRDIGAADSPRRVKAAMNRLHKYLCHVSSHNSLDDTHDVGGGTAAGTRSGGCSDIAKKVLSLGIPSDLSLHSMKFRDDARVQYWVIKLFLWLSLTASESYSPSFRCDTKSILIDVGGAISLCRSVMERNNELNPYGVLSLCCDLLGDLVKDCEYMMDIVVTSSNTKCGVDCFQWIVLAMTNHRDNLILQESGCRTLARLFWYCRDISSRGVDDIRRIEAVIVWAMRNDPANRNVQLDGCVALFHLVAFVAKTDDEKKGVVCNSEKRKRVAVPANDVIEPPIRCHCDNAIFSCTEDLESVLDAVHRIHPDDSVLRREASKTMCSVLRLARCRGVDDEP